MSLMQRIPLHADEVEIFKPESLADEQNAPIFHLRAPTRRQREDMMYAMRQEGLRLFSQEEMRDVTVEELCRLWECAETDDRINKVRAYWQAMDDYADDIRTFLIETAAAKDAGDDLPDAPAPFDHPDSAMLDELFERLDDSSPRLLRMETKNLKYRRMFPRFAVAYCLAEWTGLEASPRFDGQVLKIDSVFDIEGELDDRFGDRGKKAMHDLQSAACNRLILDKSAEKNSGSEPASRPPPTNTKEDGSRTKTAGQSQASGTSSEIPAG